MTDSLISVVPIEVIQDRRLTLEQTRVLIALFSFRNKVTNTVWPSRSAIAERTGMHPSNISSATTALVALGWLTKDGLGGHSKSTRYTLCVPTIEAPKQRTTVAHSATVAEQATVAEPATSTVAHSATTPLAYSATRKEQSIEQSNEQKKKRVTAPTFPVPDWINKTHWDAWHSCKKRKNATDAQKQMAVDKLDAWRREGVDHAAALENAAIGGWQGLFKPDERGHIQATGETAYQRSMRERIEEAAPSIARRAPAQQQDATDYFRTVDVPARDVTRHAIEVQP